MFANNGDARAMGAGVAFLLGTVMGAATALLLAPQSGQETRERLRRVGERVGEQTRRNMSGLGEKVSRAMHRGMEEAENYTAENEPSQGYSNPGSYKG
jgi:gas vesicle protein